MPNCLWQFLPNLHISDGRPLNKNANKWLLKISQCTRKTCLSIIVDYLFFDELNHQDFFMFAWFGWSFWWIERMDLLSWVGFHLSNLFMMASCYFPIRMLPNFWPQTFHLHSRLLNFDRLKVISFDNKFTEYKKKYKTGRNPASHMCRCRYRFL